MIRNSITKVHSPDELKLRFIALLLPVFLLLFSDVSQSAENVIKLSQAELVVSAADHPPQTALWRPVKLPHFWTPKEYVQGRNGWYRLVVDLPEQPNTHWGIYLRRFNMNAAVFLNQQFLADGGSFDEPLSRNWNHPLYVAVPAALWKKGENIIHVRLKSDVAYGYLAPLFVGPASLLASEYERQNLLQLDISKALFPVMVAISLFIFGLWLRRRQDTQYLWFSLAVLMWSIFSLNMFIRDQPFSTKTWEWIAHSSLDWWVILFGIFVYRFINRARPKLERLYFLFGLTACLVYAVVDLEMLGSATRWLHGGSIVIGFLILAELINAARRERKPLYTKLAIGLALLLLLGINDWMFQYKVIGVTGEVSLHLHHYFSPFIFLFMAWHLTGRFVTALKEAETLNRELEARVTQAQHEIEQHFQTIQAMANQKAVLQERERLSHEIHDGVSGNVSNAIMMTELICRENPTLDSKRLQQLRNHLDDGLSEVRSLILTMEEDLSTVGELVSHVNDKYEQMLSSLDIDYRSEILPLHGLRKLTQKESLNLLRILQEALNNIIKHAQASQASLQIIEKAEGVSFTISDNGLGFDTAKKNGGHYGLANMKKRSREINACIEISSSPGQGTQIQLLLPAT